MSGEDDYLLTVVARDVEDFEHVHKTQLSRLPHVARIQSSFALRQIIERPVLPPLQSGDTILPAWSATLKMVKHTAIDPERNEFFRSGNAWPLVGRRRCFRRGGLEQCLGLVAGAGGPASSVAVHGASLPLIAVSTGLSLSSKRLGQALAFTRRGLLEITALLTVAAAFRPRPIDLAKAERASA